MFGSKQGSYVKDPYGAWNAEQIGVNRNLSGVIDQNLSSGPNLYTGDFTADMSPEEQAAIGNQARLASMTGDWANYYQPGQVNQQVADNQLARYKKLFEEEISPLVNEAYAGNGSGYWGGARAGANVKALRDTVTDPYSNWYSDELSKSYDRALNYGGQASSINQANISAQAVPRLIKQYGLDQKYADWTRGETAKKSYVDAALNFLNLSSGTTTYTPGKSGAGAGIGAGIGAVAGGAVAMALPGSQAFLVPLGAGIGGAIGGGV